MGGFVDFTKTWFLMFFLGAIFGKIMDASGAADSLARSVLKLIGEKRISLGVCIITFLLVSAGISAYITLFICLPIAIKMCRKANLNRAFIIAGYSLGLNVGLAIPYVAATNNMLCVDYFGTTPSAGGMLALFVSVVYAVVGMLYITWYERRLKARGSATSRPTAPPPSRRCRTTTTARCPLDLAVIPMIVPVILLNAFSMKVEVALLFGVLAALVCQFKWLPRKWEPIRGYITEAISSTTLTIVNTSAIVGFGTVIQATSGYANAVDAILGINGNPYIVAIIIINVIAGIAGASSAGLVLAAPVLQTLLPFTNPAVLHRTVVLASLGLDSLPNAGFLQTECTRGREVQGRVPAGHLQPDRRADLLRALLYVALAFILGMA